MRPSLVTPSCPETLPQQARRHLRGCDPCKKIHLDRAILTMGAELRRPRQRRLARRLSRHRRQHSTSRCCPTACSATTHGQASRTSPPRGGFGHLQKGHAIAFGDLVRHWQRRHLRRDGRCAGFPGDTYQSGPLPQPRPSSQANHSITLEARRRPDQPRRLRRPYLTVTTRGQKPRHIYRTVGYGSSFGGNPLRQHIGIGAATTVDKIEVTWPTSHRTQTFTNIKADQAFHLREGDPHPQTPSIIVWIVAATSTALHSPVSYQRPLKT